MSESEQPPAVVNQDRDTASRECCNGGLIAQDSSDLRGSNIPSGIAHRPQKCSVMLAGLAAFLQLVTLLDL